jgi:hypothetical protein
MFVVNQGSGIAPETGALSRWGAATFGKTGGFTRGGAMVKKCGCLLGIAALFLLWGC